MSRRDDVLPPSLPPRGLSRVQAAAYVGISPTLFDEMVVDGRMPKPVRINARTVWDRVKLDEAFAALPHGDLEDDGDGWSQPTV
jgi:predicted DNA-binding transcriptional regulator AlpA